MPHPLVMLITLEDAPWSGLEIRVVLWPQSTNTSVGPPDSALSDHQIVLGGGPVVYWKTHHKRTVFKKS